MFYITKRSAAAAGRPKYPFDRLGIDEAFIALPGQATEINLRASAHAWGKKLDRKFHVSKRRDGSFEVWRSK